VVTVRSTYLPRKRQPPDYRHITRGQYFNFDLYSHFGARYEFTRNGFSDAVEKWLGISQPTRRYSLEARLARLEHHRQQLRQSHPSIQLKLAKPKKKPPAKAARAPKESKGSTP
jgi:hypothetical protein